MNIKSPAQAKLGRGTLGSSSAVNMGYPPDSFLNGFSSFL
jgi:hypothetical protein